jgi:peptidoglycan/xylan/chitin deacetylase (PgdA/CDA1 family)
MGASQALRRSASVAARGKAFVWLVAGLERAARPHPHLLAVLTYHRVDDPSALPLLYPGLISAPPAEFEEQIRFLASQCRAISLTELLAVRRGEARLEPRSVLVTFDDGYRDFAEHAWPILKRYGIPVTLFVPTAYPGDPDRAFWWDRLYGALVSTGPRGRIATPAGEFRLATAADRLQAFRRLRTHLEALSQEEAMKLVDELCSALAAPTPASAVLGWPELRALAADGVVLAPHSRSHPLLDRLPREAVRDEIVGSLEDLEREIGVTPPVFAYPGGAQDAYVTRILEEAGFELAFATTRGTNDLRRTDWLRLRRINVGRASGLPLIRAQLLPWWPHRQTPNGGGSRFSNLRGFSIRVQSDRFGAPGSGSRDCGLPPDGPKTEQREGTNEG